MSEQPHLNVTVDSQTSTLHVSIQRGQGGSPYKGEISVVEDVTWLPVSADEGAVGAVAKDGAIVFYEYKEGEWGRLSASSDVSIDGSSITQNDSGQLQASGVIDSNTSDTQRIWTGTLAEYDAQHKAQSNDLCIILDDEHVLYIDHTLDSDSQNAVGNDAVTKGLSGSLDSLVDCLNRTLGLNITKVWSKTMGCWVFTNRQS